MLAREIDARAEKLGAAGDDQFVLTSDGTMRWTGDAVAKMVAADDALHPRLRIIADDRLTGASREKVETRLNLWLKTHIEKLLGPLFDLSKAEDVTGIARGIAFQLVEALGVIERSKISAEMKDLDQPSRATLRKYGVRFGAYHIYLPALLKPAARALAALLWAIKQDNVDLSALAGAQQLAGSGRTSFPVDKSLPRDAYRMLGYRQCGERAVRVDILERLADLIRPALAWREASPGEKPAGAFDGRGFVVTQAMTSLTGSAGEDFASILRALGYRMEKRPPLPPKPVVVETVAAETPPVEGAAVASADVMAEAPSEDTCRDAVQRSSSSRCPAIPRHRPRCCPRSSPLAAREETPADIEAQPEPAAEAAPEQPAVEATAESAAPAAEAPAESAVTEATPEAAEAADAPAAAETPTEPQLIEVWRPGGRNEDRRPRHERHRRSQVRARRARRLPPRPARRREARRRAAPSSPPSRRQEFSASAEGAPAEGTRSGLDRRSTAPQPKAQAAPEQRRDEQRDRGERRERFEGKGRDRDTKREKFGDRDGNRRDERDRRDRDRGRDKEATSATARAARRCVTTRLRPPRDRAAIRTRPSPSSPR